MGINEIIQLMEAVSKNGLTSFKMEEGNLKLSIKKEKEVQQIVAVSGGESVPQVITAAGTAAAVAGPAVQAEETSSSMEESIGSDKVVTSPLVGTFYSSASPDAKPYVQVGDTVKKGQVLGIIEAMKLMNEIESDFDGVVEAVLVNNEEVVEYGQPLFRIR